jgi:hypothetical protein
VADKQSTLTRQSINPIKCSNPIKPGEASKQAMCDVRCKSHSFNKTSDGLGLTVALRLLPACPVAMACSPASQLRAWRLTEICVHRLASKPNPFGFLLPGKYRKSR